MAAALPTIETELRMLDEQCADALFQSRSVLELLQSLESAPQTFSPGRVCEIDVGTGSTVPVVLLQGIEPRRHLNEDVRCAATAIDALAGYYSLSEPERKRLRERAARLTAPPGEALSWTLVGLWVFGDEAEPKGSVSDVNATKLAALSAFFENAVTALDELRRRVGRRLNPPSIRDRVKVDLLKFIVTIDNVPFQVTENQALLFHYLAGADEKGLSGPEIGSLAGWEHVEFKASQYHSRIKDPWLKSLIPPRDNKNPKLRKFRLVLPSLV